MVVGLASLRRKLTRSIPANVERAARQALAASARQMTDSMEALAPEDDGALKGSIGWTFGEPAGGKASRKQRDRGGVYVSVYAGDFSTIVRNRNGKAFQNARLQEFGTAEMRATPYFYPSVRLHRKSALSRTKRAVRKAIRDGAK